MSLDISLEQFNSIADGKYNAGQVGAHVKRDGSVTLEKVNAHVHLTGLNLRTVDPAQTLEIKEAFVKALAPHIDEKAAGALRADLGLPEVAGGIVRTGHAYEPLTRQQVRTLLDAYMPPDVRKARAEEASRTSVRASVNAANFAKDGIHVERQTVAIDKIGTDWAGFQGVTDASRLRHAEEGMRKAANGVMDVLRRPDGGRVDLTALVRKLNTLVSFAERAAALAPGGDDAGKRVTVMLASVLDRLDNGTLAAVYQGVISREVDGLKTGILRRLSDMHTLPSQCQTCERLFASISRLEARVVSEVAYRVALGKVPQEERASIQSPAERWTASAPTAHDDVRDMTTTNLEIIASRANDELKHADAKLDGIDERLRSHGFTKANSRQIGDMIRSSELTINVHLGSLVGWHGNMTPVLGSRDVAIRNTFASKEAQGIALDSTGYLVKRDEVEKYYFPEYSDAPKTGHERPLYAAFNPMRALSGGIGTAGAYGSTVIVLKPHVKQQATYTLNDSFYDLKIAITDENRIRFANALAEETARKLGCTVEDERIVSLFAPDGKVGKAIKEFYSLYDGEPFTARDTESFCTTLSRELPKNPTTGSKLDSDGVHAIMIRETGVAAAPSSLTATYDNIETLLETEGDFKAVCFGHAAHRRMEDPNAPVKLIGSDYIEAQLHGPIILGRDVEEIRIDETEITRKAEAEYAALVNPQVDKNKWIKDRIVALKGEISEMAGSSGVKISYYNGGNDPKTEKLCSDNTTEDKKEAHEDMKASMRETAKKILAGDMLEPFRQSLSLSAENVRSAFAREFGDDVSKMPAWLIDYARTIARGVYAFIDKADEVDMKDDRDVMSTIRSKVSEAIDNIYTVIKDLGKYEVTEKSERENILRDFAVNGLPGRKSAPFVTAEVAAGRVKRNPESVIALAMTIGVPAHIRAELSELGVRDGLPLAGRGLEILKGDMLAFLQKEACTGQITRVDNLLSKMCKELVAPVLRDRIDLLRPIANWEFPSDGERNAFLEWAVNSGKLKMLTEVKGVYEASNRLVDDLTAALSGNDALDMKKLAALYRPFLEVASKYGDVSIASGLEIGSDDLLALIARPESVALSRLYLRVGDAGMKKLGDALSTHEAKDFYATIEGVLAKMSARGSRDTTPMRAFQIYVWSMGSRLAEKFGQNSHFDSKLRKPFDEAPTETRNILAGMAPELVGEMLRRDTSAVPMRTMPAAANPAGMPRDLEGRKEFLLAALPRYLQHEKTFEKGRNTHGRTHATRAFVLANVLGNILSEKGVPVDMNALSLGIAGHDMGRKGAGEDKWEGDSADAAVEMGEGLTNKAGGTAWCGAVKAAIAGKDTSLEPQRTVEGYLLKAADSLDYSRVAELDPSRFHFLEAPFSCGGIVVMPDADLRAELMKEAAELTRLTDAYTEHREELDELMSRLNGPDALAVKEKYNKLADSVAMAEISQSKDVGNQQIIELVERTIRDNADKFPLLNTYYR